MDLDLLEERIKKLQNQIWKFEKRLIKMLFVLFTNAISYLIALWVYLWIYDVYGWERTLIALGVGVIIFNLRSNVSHAGK